LGYYGLAMNVSNLGSSVYISSAVAALVELPAYVVAIWSIDSPRIGRRGATAGGLIFGGFCCVLSAFTPGWGLLVLAFTGKFAVALAFAVVYLYAAELFPTSVRSRSMGLQSLAARVGGMGASIVADLGKTSQALPMIIFGAPCLVAGLFIGSLPETLGRPMLDTIDDIAAPGSKETSSSGCLWPMLRYNQLDEDARELEVRNGPEPRTLGASV